MRCHPMARCLRSLQHHNQCLLFKNHKIQNVLIHIFGHFAQFEQICLLQDIVDERVHNRHVGVVTAAHNVEESRHVFNVSECSSASSCNCAGRIGAGAPVYLVAIV
uniref:Uncharacterized protein n=1 Tax=Heterorhabditis bacteriophora TaxID=37862 RepID=A0A1I7WDT3_HETBA